MKEQKYIDFTEILKGHEGKWVVISDFQTEPKVVGSGTSVEEAMKQAAENGDEDGVLMKVPKEWISWVFEGKTI